MCSATVLHSMCFLFMTAFASGCSINGDSSVPLSDLDPTEAIWVDQLLDTFSPPESNVLQSPSSLMNIVQHIRRYYPDMQPIEYYKRHGYIIVALRVFSDQQPHDKRNVLNVMIVNTKTGRYQFSLAMKS